MSGRLGALLALAITAAGCMPPEEQSSVPAAEPQASVTSSLELGTSFSESAFLEACEDWDEWDKPAPPFQLLGDTWYVGTCGISAILIIGEDEHVLIDSGVDAAVPLVLDNIRALGLDPRDVGHLLMSHEHFDHVGGHAAMMQATVAKVLASAEAAKVLEAGAVSPDDPQSAIHPAMTPVKVDRIVTDGDVLRIDDKDITAHLTPGHTPGAMSWTWPACSLPWEPPVCRTVAYVDSLSPVSSDEYRFSDHPALLTAFRASIVKVAQLRCELLITPHPSASRMFPRLVSGELLGGMSCADYAISIGDRLEARLAEEAAS